MDFITQLPVSTNWKSKTYDLMMIIVNRLIKIVYYELVQVIINGPVLLKS